MHFIASLSSKTLKKRLYQLKIVAEFHHTEKTWQAGTYNRPTKNEVYKQNTNLLN
jgi:hypothetical protein